MSFVAGCECDLHITCIYNHMQNMIPKTWKTIIHSPKIDGLEPYVASRIWWHQVQPRRCTNQQNEGPINLSANCLCYKGAFAQKLASQQAGTGSVISVIPFFHLALSKYQVGLRPFEGCIKYPCGALQREARYEVDGGAPMWMRLEQNEVLNPDQAWRGLRLEFNWCS